MGMRRWPTNQRKGMQFMNIDTFWPPKTCNQCKQVKPTSEFPVLSYIKDTLRTTCRQCINKAQLARLTPEKKHYFNLRYEYGLTVEQYDAMLASQNGVCAICKKRETFTRSGKKRRLCVDHCHDTGLNRGLLCGKCNVALGYFTDSIPMLESAISYLAKHKKKETNAVNRN